MVCVCTFSALHSLDEDPSALWENPIAAAVAVLTVAHGPQSMRRFEQLPPDQILLLHAHKYTHKHTQKIRVCVCEHECVQVLITIQSACVYL